jgi:hypothetical protein
MPFKSEKQRRWMYANEPEMAKRWSEEEDDEDREKRRKKAAKKRAAEMVRS